LLAVFGFIYDTILPIRLPKTAKNTISSEEDLTAEYFPSNGARSQPIVRAISVTTEIWLLPCACWQDGVLIITALLFGLSPFPNWITQLHRDTAMITRNGHLVFPDGSSRL